MNKEERLMENAKIILPKERAVMNPVSLMGDEKGIYFTFMSDLGAISQALPAPLEPVFPMVSGYVVEIDKPAFAKSYREAMIGVYANYKGTVGLFPVAFLLSGPGAEMATLGGRERFGLPKKMCESEDCIRIEREGGRARAVASRGGVTLLDVSIKLGRYNDPAAANFYAGAAPGAVSGGMSFYAQPVMEPDGSGYDVFKKVNLYTNIAEYTYRTWEPGEVTVRLQSSENDAWGSFPVFANLGGAFSENDIVMKDLQLAEQLDVGPVINKLLVTRYDGLSFIQGV
jgi:acetoacetate decarboxylase